LTALALAAALGGSAAAAAVPATTGARPVDYRFHYLSPYTGLEYDHDSRAAGSDRKLTTFRLPTDFGVLAGRILVGELLSRIVLEHEDSGLRSVVDYVHADTLGNVDIHLAFPERNEDVYYKTDDREADNVVVVSRTGPDCSTLESTGLYLATREASRLLIHDYDLSLQPPGHLERITAAVVFAESLTALDDGCRGAHDPAAGVCYFDHESYGACSRCCDGEADMFSLVCNLGKAAVCHAPWCKKVGSVICGGLKNLYVDTCVSVMCKGKPGDPDCPPDQECGEVEESSCWEFCGITRRSVCGTCPAGKSCCAPM
jgi:hypothetical protein